ncbi:MAG: hypothetical protein OSJ37_07840 [Muribaculaceae bacterium]|nr:hypothetical protein [Muribaculaceae bacterium]
MNIQQYIFNIGSLLSQLGNELQMQAQSSQPLNIHSQVKQTMDNLTYCLHNLNADLDACRYNLIIEGKSNLNPSDVESLKVALHHLLNGENYTHNGESSSPTEELYKMMFLIDYLYRLMAHGAQGSKEYIFDKITDKDI